MNKKILSVIVTVVMVINMIGCGSKAEIKGEKGENNLKGSTITVYCAYDNEKQIFKKFTEETGIKVEFMDVSSGEVLSKLKASKGVYVADVWFGGGVDSYIPAKEQGFLEKYVSKEAKDIEEDYKDKDGYWTGVSFTLAGLVVNTDVMSEKKLDIPKKWSELSDSKYKDEITLPNPSVSGTCYTVISGLLQNLGEEKGWEYLKSLSNNVPFYCKRGSEPAKKASLGEIGIGVSPIGIANQKLEKTHPVKIIYPEDGIPWTIAPVAVLKNAKNVEGAKAFVDWSLSKHGQEIMSKESPRIQVRKDIEISSELGELTRESLMKFDLFLAGKERDNTIEKWNKECAK